MKLLNYCLYALIICLALPAWAYSPASHQKSQIMQTIIDEAVKQNFSPALALAIADVESNFNPRATSPVGARGVMQIMPNTGKGEFGLEPYQLYNPHTNIKTGIQFIKQLIKQYDGRVDIALSHYNGGSKVRTRSGRLRVIPATKNYVAKVQKKAASYQHHPRVIAVNGTGRGQQIARRLNSLDDFNNGSIRPRKARFNQQAIVQVSTHKRQQLVAALQALRVKNKARLSGLKTNTLSNPRQSLVRSWESYN